MKIINSQVIRRVFSNQFSELRRKGSQLGQDKWVSNKLKKTKIDRKYFFCDVGAGDPINFSNTYRLEKTGNWEGILVEADPRRCKELKIKRKSIVVNYAVSENENEILEVATNPDFSSLAKVYDKHRLFQHSGEQILVKGKRLDEILSENNAPINFEFLSIDVEGAELSVLKTINLTKWKPKYVTIEHNYRPDREIIYNLLNSVGYVRVVDIDTAWDDWYELR